MKHNVKRIIDILEDGLENINLTTEEQRGIELAITWIENNIS